jgi:hypothetical protein
MLPAQPTRAELAQRMGELNAALLTVAALRLLFARADVDDAEQLRVARALLAGELGIAATPTLQPTVFKWSVLDKERTFVLELGEGPLP